MSRSMTAMLGARIVIREGATNPPTPQDPPLLSVPRDGRIATRSRARCVRAGPLSFGQSGKEAVSKTGVPMRVLPVLMCCGTRAIRLAHSCLPPPPRSASGLAQFPEAARSESRALPRQVHAKAAEPCAPMRPPTCGVAARTCGGGRGVGAPGPARPDGPERLARRPPVRAPETRRHCAGARVQP